MIRRDQTSTKLQDRDDYENLTETYINIDTSVAATQFTSRL